MRGNDDAARAAAWGVCYSVYRQMVWSRVFYVIRTVHWLPEPRETVEEITSDVFVSLPDALSEYREEGKAEQWLKRIAVRTALRARERLTGAWQQKGGRPEARKRTYVTFDESVDEIVQRLDAVDADELLELERRIARLRTSDDGRERRWAEFIDWYREGYGFAEIAQRLGISEGTARNWLVAIRRYLAGMNDREGE
jgi:RNA polymerase sigma factor (sigma-70 family)